MPRSTVAPFGTGLPPDAVPEAYDVMLDGDLRSPAAARRLVTGALTAAGLHELLDACLLLTSELVTNAVVHAGTAVRLRCSTDAGGVLVAVSDANPGSLRGTGDRGDLAESGRGVALVEALADRWGTEHTRAGKTIWFACSVSGPAPPAPAAVPPASVLAPAARPGAVPPARPAVLLPGDEVAETLTLPEELAEVLVRLLEALGAVDGAVALDGEPPVRRVLRAASGACRELREPVGGERSRFGAVVVRLDAPEQPGDAEILRAGAATLAFVLRRRRLHQQRAEQDSRLAFLAEASELLAGSLNVEQSLALLARLAVPLLGHWAATHAVDEEGDARLVGLAAPTDDELDPLREALAREGAPNTATSTTTAAEGAWRLVVPLRARQRLVGMLSVSRPGRRYTPDEVQLAEDLSRRAALAVDNARLFQQQVAVAVGLQQALLPAALPVTPGLDFGAVYLGVREGLAVGGDFYDVVPLGPGRFGLAIGDVCGKGAEAAALTGVARDVLRLLLREGRPLPAVLAALNTTILLQGEHGRFCTVGLAELEQVEAGGARVGICSAGHPPPVLVRASGEVSLVRSSGALLGVLTSDELDTVETTVLLGAGDSLVFYTDGVTERRRGDRMFGEHLLQRAAATAAGLPAPAQAAALQEAALDFAPGPLRDDLAVLVVRCTA